MRRWTFNGKIPKRKMAARGFALKWRLRWLLGKGGDCLVFRLKVDDLMSLTAEYFRAVYDEIEFLVSLKIFCQSLEEGVRLIKLDTYDYLH